MLKDQIRMFWEQSGAFVVFRYFSLFFYKANAPDREAICVLLTHINVSDLIELHNITLAVCLQICSVTIYFYSTQKFWFEIRRFAKFWAELVFFEKDN
jgi:hypothetical protein